MQHYRCQTEGRVNDLAETITEIIDPAPRRRRISGAALNVFRLQADARGPYTSAYQTLGWTAAPGLDVRSPAFGRPDTVTLMGSSQGVEWYFSDRYRLASTVVEVSGKREALSVETTAGRQRSGLHLGGHQRWPVLQVAGALASQARFSNFEAGNERDGAYGFAGTGADTLRDAALAHTGTGSFPLDGTAYLEAAMPAVPTGTTLPLPPGGPAALVPATYRLVFWARPDAAGAVVTARITNGNATVPGTRRDVPLADPLATPGQWQRYGAELPWRALNLPATGCRLRLTGQGGRVLLDDVLLLPAGATAASTTHDPATGAKTSQIDATGRTSYVEYDLGGEPWLVRDHNRDIVQRTERRNGGRPQSPARNSGPCLGTPALNQYAGALTTDAQGWDAAFEVTSFCPATVSATAWDFGDNTPVQDAGRRAGHTFALGLAPRTATVRVRLTTAQGIVTLTHDVRLPAARFNPTLCVNGLTSFDLCADRRRHVYTVVCTSGLPSPVPTGGPPPPNNRTGTQTSYVVVQPPAVAGTPHTYAWTRWQNVPGQTAPIPAPFTAPPTNTHRIIVNSATDNGFFYRCVVDGLTPPLQGAVDFINPNGCN